MSGSLLLFLSLGGLAAAIAVLGTAVFGSALRTRGPAGQAGIIQGIATIEQRYARQPAQQERISEPLVPVWLRDLMMRLTPSGLNSSLQRRLDLAGNTARWNPDRLFALKGMCFIGLGLIGAVNGLDGFHSYLMLVVLGALAGGVGFFIPDSLLYNAGVKRQDKIQRQLPDALDMLTVAVEAGMAFDGAVAQVARKTSGPLAAELTRVQVEMQIGKSRTEALKAMVDRTSIPELRTFVFSVVQATELGIPMGDVLREQSKEMRLKRRQRAEERAQQLSVKILFPLVTCLFPAMMIIIIGPGALRIFSTLFAHG